MLPTHWRRPVADQPAPYRACDDPLLVCRGIIYAFPIWEIHHKTGMIILYAADPTTGQLLLDPAGEHIKLAEVPEIDPRRRDARPRVVWDYVGQTIRELEIRTAEHVEDKCWSDVIAGPPIKIEEGSWDKAERDRREINMIHKMAPRFNRSHNDGNRRRIPIWRQKELRHARDRAAGRALWIPLEQRTELALRAAELAVIGAGLSGPEPRYPLTIVGQMLKGLTRWIFGWSPRVRMAGLLVLAWAITGVLGACALIRWGWPVHYSWLASLVINTAILAGLAGGGRRRRRR